MTKLKIGDRVAFSAVYLRSIGSLAGRRCRFRGKIVGFAPDWDELAEVEWDFDEPVLSFVNVFNLIRAQDICREASTADTRSGHGPDRVYGGSR